MPMVIGQLKVNMEGFEELKVCADIMNEMLSSFYKVPEMVTYCYLPNLNSIKTILECHCFSLKSAVPHGISLTVSTMQVEFP